MRTLWFGHYFCQKLQFLCDILVFEPKSQYYIFLFFIFLSFCKPDLQQYIHSLYRFATKYNRESSHFSVILSFLKQNWNILSVYIFLSFRNQIYIRIPFHFIDFPHMTMRTLWFWQCFSQKDHIFSNFIVVPPRLQ